MHNTAGVEHKNNVLMEYSAWRYLAANVALYKNLLAHSGLQVDGALLKRVQHEKPCEERPGYETLADAMVIYGTGNFFPTGREGSIEGSTAAAFAVCNSDPDCITFNNYGYTGNLGSMVFLATGTEFICTYFKKQCPDKLGFEAHAHQLLTHPAGCNGTGNSSHSGGGEPFVDRLPYVRAAEAFCRMNNNCSAFSSDGSYMIGGPVELEPKPGICTYRKQLCPPMIGFTAFEGVSFRVQYPPDSTPASSTSSPSSLTDVYQVCRQDPACVAFDNLHRYWSITAPSSVELCGPGNTNPVPGACLYYKNPDGVTWSI
ncbi:hypothetical protein VOLCADRAFT_89238 [Volvox carteri f. nagariensis]|uniref:Uncharacterized protein n=1 Tax=Volvox carteri f. nagariensis TaxID=3068 RepID=D8TR64_VOLCA|nr:uncharacterized protein VOLCADRAFT_89238 [Volvox carteri f. nagariensis]EFJ50147.1 hypothetical protein VOLCADRAFT_89238 [Volvox carteri f. nagariensis]|eukprot:XP_002948767.1 hypothetical protein VOLCADRAFT_89238 [Volvox carteri f. nagariensis]